MAELELSALLERLGDPLLAIESSEREYFDKVDSVARHIVGHPGIRVMLLSGPSGSGKTTTANLICDRIKAFGERSMVISLDDFYKSSGDESYPLLENGEPDYESPFALDLDVLSESLRAIISGEEFSVPKYDFKAGGRVGFSHYPPFSDGCVIIEGIHGLNPIISASCPEGAVLKLFVSVSTNINVSGKRILSGKKVRFLRRTVRDSIYRASDAEKTLSMWKNVLIGEEKYLYPYKEEADIKFDTFHSFELSVLKPFAKRLLTDRITEESYYARVVAEALTDIPEYDYRQVPESSLIREFVPGGIYEDLY